MVSTLSYFLLFGIVILTNGKPNYYNERSEDSEDLIQQLSSLKAKHGLNFVNIEGTGSLLENFKKTHPKAHYIEPSEQVPQYDNTPEINNYEQFNMLVDINKHRPAPILHKDQIKRMRSLRICKKEPKPLKCNKGKCESEEKNISEDECDSDNEKKKEKKRHYRAGNNKQHFTGDETVQLLNDLEKLLVKNSKYNIFLGCVGNMCRGRSNTDRNVEERDNSEVQREYLGCIGDRCGERRDDGNDATDVRRYE